MNKSVKILLEVVLAAVIVLLVWLTVKSVQKPVKFNNEVAARSQVAIQRLKDIRTLQVAFKSVNGRFSPTMDSLKLFYETGKMDIVMQIGSHDDSIAVANTEAIKKANRRLKPDQMTAKLQEAYAAGQKVVFSITTPIQVKDTLFNHRPDFCIDSLAVANTEAIKKANKKLKPAEMTAKLAAAYEAGQKVVFSVTTPIQVKDTLFHNRPDFCIDSLAFIPFSGGQPVEMEATIKTVSGVQVPLFEARMPYKALCKGLDNQLRVNLDADRKDQNKYEGLQVGSVTAPNNNAGNWE